MNGTAVLRNVTLVSQSRKGSMGAPKSELNLKLYWFEVCYNIIH